MLTAIICTYNRAKYIGNLLESIAANDLDKKEYEILLVDNNCTDNTREICEAFAEAHKDVQFRYTKEPEQGLSAARNRGIKESHGETLLFLDDDSYIQQDYLKNLQRQLNDHPEADAFGGKIDPIFESGETPKWLSKWNYSWVSAIDMGDKVCQFEGKAFPIGANMGIRKATIEKTGVFNTQLGRSKKNLMGGEEKDLFERIRQQGGNIYYFPDVVVQHVIPPSRTTLDYVKRLGEGVGSSERIRTLGVSKGKYLKRLFSELVKWGGTIILWMISVFQGKPQIGRALILFRHHVSKGLLGHIKE
jgi:glycosyltransferase involved in cell wall biosynthesis